MDFYFSDSAGGDGTDVSARDGGPAAAFARGLS